MLLARVKSGVFFWPGMTHGGVQPTTGGGSHLSIKVSLLVNARI